MEEQVKSFLEEGYDFIEESCSTEPLKFTEADNDIIIESSDGVKSPYHILGVCKGVFQPINEPSRNGRIYESNHWSLQLNKPEVQDRIKTRSMWGTLGHFDRKISDADIREGLVSHIISKLEIHEDANNKPFLYGELEILDTPAGKILEAMYKGGANLFVSSRGAGKLISVGGDTMKHVDPNSFYFEGFDIVRAPGFLKARPVYESTPTEVKKPALHESLSESVSEAQDIETLKCQLDKMAKILEKVVDDVYEETSEAQEEPKEKVLEKKSKEAPQMQEQPIASAQKEKANESLIDFVSLMAGTTISEKAFEEILDTIIKAKGNK